MSIPKIHRAYLAGPMTGLPQHNFAAFDEGAATLREMGLEVCSPAQLDRQFGITGYEDSKDIPTRLVQEIMLIELREISTCDIVLMLPGWEKSKGANIEKIWATLWHIPVETFEEFLSDCH